MLRATGPFTEFMLGMKYYPATGTCTRTLDLPAGRFVVDEDLPDDEQLTPTNIRNGQGPELQPAGLLGPVRLLSSQDIVVHWRPK